MATVVHGDFEWDEEKAAANRVKHGVTFEEALLALKDSLSLDFDDLVEPENLRLSSRFSGLIRAAA